jgi:hypothetical protein
MTGWQSAPGTGIGKPLMHRGESKAKLSPGSFERYSAKAKRRIDEN